MQSLNHILESYTAIISNTILSTTEDQLQTCGNLINQFRIQHYKRDDIDVWTHQLLYVFHKRKLEVVGKIEVDSISLGRVPKCDEYHEPQPSDIA